MKKSVSKVLAVVLIMSVFLTLFSACSSSDKSKIVGEWKDSTGLTGYEFKKDGSAKFNALGFPVTVSYEINTKDKTLKLSGTGLLSYVNIVYEYELSGDTLTLTEKGTGLTGTYTRV